MIYDKPWLIAAACPASQRSEDEVCFLSSWKSSASAHVCVELQNSPIENGIPEEECYRATPSQACTGVYVS